ncbi:hypothetical protein ROZALSC1DRAFT_25011, partial [Rozella allomycis CSF55]
APCFASPIKLSPCSFLVSTVNGKYMSFDIDGILLFEGSLGSPIFQTPSFFVDSINGPNCIISSQDSLVVINANSGVVLKTIKLTHPLNGSFCFMAKEGSITAWNIQNEYLVNIDLSTLILKKTINVGETFSSPVTNGNYICLGNRNDQLVCVQIF